MTRDRGPADPAQQRGVDRQEDVEAHLDHERPRLRDAAERAERVRAVHDRAAGVVEVDQEEVLEDAAAARRSASRSRRTP